MALSPNLGAENEAAVLAVFDRSFLGPKDPPATWKGLGLMLDAARAQGRASLEERVRLLEEGLRALKGTCSSFCDCDGDFVAGQVQIRIAALLATPGEREQ